MVIEKTKKVFLKLDAEGIKKLTELGTNQAEFKDLVKQGIEWMPLNSGVTLDNGDRHYIRIQKNSEGIVFIAFASILCIVVETTDAFAVYNIPDSFFEGYDVFDIQPIIRGKIPELTLTKIKNQMGI